MPTPTSVHLSLPLSYRHPPPSFPPTGLRVRWTYSKACLCWTAFSTILLTSLPPLLPFSPLIQEYQDRSTLPFPVKHSSSSLPSLGYITSLPFLSLCQGYIFFSNVSPPPSVKVRAFLPVIPHSLFLFRQFYSLSANFVFLSI